MGADYLKVVSFYIGLNMIKIILIIIICIIILLLKHFYNNIQNKIKEIISLRHEAEILSQKIKEQQETFSNYENNLEAFKEKIEYCKESYINNILSAYKEVEREYDTNKEECENKIEKLKEAFESEKAEAAQELEKIKESISAGVKAQLREQAIEEKTSFYQITLSNTDLSDIIKLQEIKSSLNQPVILSKLIWSTYFQKQVSQLCNKIYGTEQKCGIYKITNLKNKQCYIGQSVNIQERIKQHCKCGLGIDAPSTNKLYSSMQKDGIWNFTFELLEECKKEELNEKEKLWISIYEADKYGLNSTKGNK